MPNLLLFSLRGSAYAVREEEVASVTRSGQVHHLPLSPTCVAGMAIIEDRGTTIIDLSVCVGDRPLDSGTAGSYLLVGSDDRRTGFWVEGTVETSSFQENRVLPLPDLVSCDLVESCVVHQSRVVPIINISLLQQRISRGELNVPQPTKQVALPGSEHLSAGAVRVFSLGTGSFCAAAEGSVVLPQADGLVRPLPFAHKRVLGVIYHDGTVIPVLPLEERLGLPSAEAKSVLIAEQDGKRFGLLISSERGVTDSGSVQLLPVPPLVRSGMISRVALENGELIPLLDLAGLVAAGERSESGGELAERYTGGSRFKELFRQGPVDLSEMALFGGRHAVPREEVVEVLPLRELRQIPLSPSIVLGVVERNKTILPVLDLAAIFGKRSPIDSSWSLLRIRNGDFEALVAVEEVYGVKNCGVDIQRQVPIVLPYDVLYGCYLDDGAVRLILNVQALTVHFEETTIRDFMTSVSPAAQQTSEEHPVAAMVPATELPTEEPPAKPQVPRGAVPTMGSVVAVSVRQPQELPQAASSPAEVQEGTPTQPGVQEAEESSGRTTEMPPGPAADAYEGDQEAARRLREQEESAAEAERTAQEERRLREEQERANAEEERTRLAHEEKQRAEQLERERTDAAARHQRKEEQLRAERERQQEEERRALLTAREAETLRQARDGEERAPREQERPFMSNDSTGATLSDRIPLQEQAPSAPRLPPALEERGRLRKYLIAAAVLVLIAVAFLNFSKKEQTSLRDRAGEHAAITETKIGQRTSPPARDAEPPLVLTVPRSAPAANGSVYVVLKGDTLWGIAKRFTGNPFNYPRLARDNSIATPNLIFPGQKIKLKKE